MFTAIFVRDLVRILLLIILKSRLPNYAFDFYTNSYLVSICTPVSIVAINERFRLSIVCKHLKKMCTSFTLVYITRRI